MKREPSVRERVEALREEIRRHDYLYYVLDRPEITDAEYDALYAELARLESAHPQLITADSPTQRVAGAPLAAFPETRHLAPMLSLQSVTETGDVRRFAARLRDVLRSAPLRLLGEPKLDGLSIEVVYEKGRLVRASTRGDGERGEGVTENVKAIASVPLSLRASQPIPELLSVRGEVVMPLAAFERLNERLAREQKPLFANARNAAAGSVRQLDARITASRTLRAFFYDVLAQRGGRTPHTQTELLASLRAWGLPVVSGRALESVQDVLEFHRDMERRRSELEYEIDGIVLKLDELAARERLRATARHPRWALAFKFAAREASSVLRDIVVQVGRTGVLTPVAVLAPVEIGGATVTRATLHNREEIARKDLRVGDRVRVVRAGDVIPEIVARVEAQAGKRTRGRRFAMPARCPECGAAVVHEGPFDRCPNRLACPAQLKRALEHFGSRGGLDIRGLGPSTVEALVNASRVRSVADLFTLQRADLLALDGYGDKSAANLLAAIRGAKQPPLGRLLYALGIPSVGEGTARELAAHFEDLPSLLGASEAALRQVPGLGAAAAAEVHQFLAERETRKVIAACSRLGVQPRAEARARRTALANKHIVFTGKLTELTRQQARDAVRELGGRVGESVSRETDWLVAGERPGSKRERAQQLGVRILSEPEFLRLVRQYPLVKDAALARKAQWSPPSESRRTCGMESLDAIATHRHPP